MRLPGIAPGLPPWRGGILAVKSQPRKLKGPGESSRSGPFAISTKNKHLLVIHSIPTRGFTAVVSVFGAHLLRSPSIVKSGLIVLALDLAMGGHTTPVELDRSFSPNSVLRHSTSSRCPFASTHSFDPFVRWFSHSWTNKKPCSHRGKQGLENFFGSSFTCLPPGYPNSFQGLALYTMWIG